MVSGLLLLLTVLVALYGAVTDFRSLRIPNASSIIIMAAFGLAYTLSPESFAPWWHHLSAVGIMFLTTYVMYCCGLLGGGDAKLASVLALWLGLKGLFPFLFIMSLVGGVLALLSIVIRKKKPFKNPRVGGWVHTLQEQRSAVPYGIALAAGYVAAIFHTPYLHQQIHEVIKIIS